MRTPKGFTVATARSIAGGKFQIFMFPDSPLIIRAPKDQFLNESNPLILFCNATGKPTPNITWEKIGGSGRVFGPSQMLFINQTSKMDEGTYRCIADNGIGSTVNRTAYVGINGR